MAKSKPLRVVLDTNILISAYVFGGKPGQVNNMVIDKRIIPFISPTLLAELTDTLLKKFDFGITRIEQIERIVNRHFNIVYPAKNIYVARDEDDNRVLEAAVEGKCDYVITGDIDLLSIGKFKRVKIVTADQFLDILES